MHSVSFGNNPSNYRPSGKSETQAKDLCVKLATSLGYTTSVAAIDYTKVVNADVLIHRLKHLRLMYSTGVFNGLEKQVQEIAKRLGITLTKA